MATYRFLTLWLLEAPIESVWDALVDYQALPTWWKAVKQVSLLQEGQPDGTGGVWRIAWKTPLGYPLVFESKTTGVEPPHRLELAATGEVEGMGRWELQATDAGTQVYYHWHVTTTKAWMNLLAVFIRPLMEWNHNAIMREGGYGLAQHLGVKLLREEVVDPTTISLQQESI